MNTTALTQLAEAILRTWAVAAVCTVALIAGYRWVRR